MTQIETEDILRVVNRGDHTVSIGWDSKYYNLEPDKDTFVPFAAVTNAFGDPRSGANMVSVQDSRGIIGWVPDRATEVRRLRAKYDNQMGDENVVTNHPHVEVYTLEGERVLTVLEDQSGDTVLPTTQTQAQQSAQAGQVAALLEKQRVMEAQLQALLDNQGTTAPQAAPEPFQQPPEDTAVEVVEQDPTMPPEDTGGDVQPGIQRERVTPEAGSPKVNWNTLSEGQS